MLSARSIIASVAYIDVHGVTIVEDCSVEAIHVKNGAVVGLRTNQGELISPIVVNCAGQELAVASAVQPLVQYEIAKFRLHTESRKI